MKKLTASQRKILTILSVSAYCTQWDLTVCGIKGNSITSLQKAGYVTCKSAGASRQFRITESGKQALAAA